MALGTCLTHPHPHPHPPPQICLLSACQWIPSKAGSLRLTEDCTWVSLLQGHSLHVRFTCRLLCVLQKPREILFMEEQCLQRNDFMGEGVLECG